MYLDYAGNTHLKMITQWMFAIVGLFFALILPAFGDYINITNIIAVSGNPYEDGGFIDTRAEVFFDEKITLADIPDEIKGAQFIKGWNKDAKWRFNNPQHPVAQILPEHRNFLTFTVDRSIQLWVLHDSSNDEVIKADFTFSPWLWNDFDQTSVQVSAKGAKIEFTLYKAKKIFLKGKIILGSLASKGKIMYVPLVAGAVQDVQTMGKLATFWGGLKVVR